MNSRKTKTKKFNNLILKSFIVIAVLMMLTDVLPSQAIYSQTQKITKAADPSLNTLVSGVGAQANDNFGWNVSCAGDLNGDGYNDTIVGAPYNDSADGSKTDCGAVYIFFGYSGISSGNLNAANANITIYGANQSDHFGWSVNYAGNVDGDGDCVIIGAPDNNTADGGNASAGAVYIFNRTALNKTIQTTLNATNANYTIYGGNVGDKFGFSVSKAGNVSSATYDDIVIGAPYNDTLDGSKADAGMAYVFYGDGSIPTNVYGADANLTGENANDNFGLSVADVGDVNGDGWEDVAVGAPGHNSSKGKVYVFGNGSTTIYKTIQPPNDGSAKCDTMIASGYGDTNYGTQQYIWVGYYSFGASKNKNERGMIKFDISNITPGATIINATMELQYYGVIDSTNKYAIEAHRITAPWTETGATWNNNNTIYDATVIANNYTYNPAYAGCVGWNLTTLVQSWNNGVYPNYGIMLISPAAESAAVNWERDFRSADYTGPAARPRLRVTYIGNGLALIRERVGENTGDKYGFTICAMGNITGDPTTDFAIGAPGYITSKGRVYLDTDNATVGVYGSDSQFANFETGADSAYYVYNAEWIAQQFPISSALTLTNVSIYISDLGATDSITVEIRPDAGGLPDMSTLLGTYTNDTASGYGWCLFGPYNILLNKGLYWICAENTNSVNTDSYAWYADDGAGYSYACTISTDQGTTWIDFSTSSFYFRANGTTLTGNVVITGAQNGDQFGYSLGSGNITGDNRSELIVGAPYNDTSDGGTSNAGGVYIFNTSYTLPTTMTALDANYTNYGATANDNFGFSVSYAGDINNDRYNDTIVGAPFNDIGETNAGAVYVLTTAAVSDTTDPTSNVDTITPYWNNAAITITATASDNVAVQNVTLWYRFSTDNSSWGDWVSFGTDTDSPWSWSFSFSNDTGYYEFYSRANDTSNNYEDALGAKDALCGYETTKPDSSVTAISSYWQTSSPLTITATASDTGGSGLKNVTLYYYNSTNNSTFSGPWEFGTDTASPWSWDFDFPNGTQYYRFYSIAGDNATNTENAPTNNDTICGYDNALPTSTISTPSADPAYYNTTSIWLNGTCSDALSGINRVEINITWKDNGTTYLAWTSANLAANYSWWNYSFTPPNEANFTVYIRAVDNVSNYQVAITRNVTYDITKPTSSVDIITPYWRTNQLITITVSNAADSLSGVKRVRLYYRYSSDNSSWGDWDYYTYATVSPYTFNFNTINYGGDGFFEFYSMAVDNAGNVEDAPGAKDALAATDTTDPTSSVNTISPYEQNTSPLTITGTASDDNATTGGESGLATVELWARNSTDNSTWSDWWLFDTDTDPWISISWSFTFPNGTGYYEFYSIAKDNATNIESAPTNNDTLCQYQPVTNQPPNPPTLTSPDNNTWTNDSTPYFDWDFSDPDGGDTQGGFHVQINSTNDFGVPAYDYNSSTNTSTFWDFPIGTEYTTISDGTWYWRVKTMDNNDAWGNWSGWNITKIDTALPTSTIQTPSADPAYYNTTGSIWLNGTCSDALSGINRVEINITWKDNGTTYLAWTNANLSANYSWWNYSFTPPNEANFTVYIRAVDNASNYQVAITRNVTYDATAPTNPTSCTEDGGAVNNTWQNGTSDPSFTWSGDGDGSGSGVSGYYYYWGTSETGTGASTNYTTSASYNPSAPGEGTFYLRVKTRDNAGNNVTWATVFVFKYDGTAPTNPTSCTEWGGAANNTWQNTVSNPDFAWDGAGDDSGSGVSGYYYYWGTSASGASTNYTTSTGYDPSAPGEGAFYLRIKTRDNAGNNASWVTIFVFKYDATAPSVTAVSPAAGATNIAVTTTIAKTFDEAMNQSSVEANFKVYKGNAPSPGTLVEGTYSWSGNQCTFTPSSPLSPDTKYWSNVSTSATDLAGNPLSAANNTWFTTTAGVGVTVNSPNGGEVWQGSSTKWLNFTISGGSGPYTYWINYSTNGGSSWLAHNTSTVNNNGTYNWSLTVWSVSSENCYVNITMKDPTTSGYDTSNSPFTIDSTAPTSSASTISPYWSNGGINVPASAFDNYQLKNITLYYAYSSDNNTGWPAALADYTKGETKEISSTSYEYTFSFLPPTGEGYYRFYTRAGDLVGNIEDIPAVYDALAGYDTTPPSNPNTNTSSPSVDVWSSDNTIYVTWGGQSDARSGIAGFYYCWSTASDTVPTSSDTWTADISTTSSALSDSATWYLHVRAKDNATNLGTGAYHIGPFKIDTTAPTNPTSCTEAGGAVNNTWQNSTSDPSFTWSGATDGSGSDVSGYYYYWGTSASGTGASTNYTTSASYDPSAPGEGTLYLRIKTRDNVGNNASWVTLFVFKYDATVPTNPTSCSESGGALNNTWQNSVSNPSFTWSGASDGSGSDVSGYYYYWGTSGSGTGASTNYTTSASYDPSAPGEGTFYLRVKTRDNAGNNASWATIFVFRYDGTKPTSTIATPAESSYFNYKPIWLNGTCTDALSGANRVEINITWKNNGTTYLAWTNATLAANCTWWNYSFSPPNDANFTIYIRAVDNASNYQAPIRINITYDVTPPTTNIVLVGTLGTNGWYISDVVANITAVDNLSGVLKIEYRIGVGSWTSYVGNFSFTAEGNTTIYTRAIDIAGSVELPYKYRYVLIDKTDPPEPELLLPANDTWTNNNTVFFDWSESSDMQSGTANYTLQVSKNESFSYFDYNATVTVSEKLSASLADGTYYWRVLVRDNASNTNYSQVRIIKIDTVLPGEPTLSLPENNTNVSDNTPTFKWQSVIDVGSGTNNYVIEISNITSFSYVLYTANSTANITTATESIKDGIYYWHVRAVDYAGNRGNWSGWYKLTIMSGAPEIKHFWINYNANYTNSLIVNLTISCPGIDAVNGWINLSNDGSTWTGWMLWSVYNGSIPDWNLSECGGNNSEGIKWVHIQCKNSSVGAIAEKYDTIILDRTLPNVNLLSPEHDKWLNNLSVNFSWKAWDNFELEGTYHINITYYENSTVLYEYYISGGSIINNATTSNFSTLPKDGKYNWSIRAKDKANNWCLFVGFWTVKIDTAAPTAPELLSPANNSETDNITATFAWRVNTDFSGINYCTIQIAKSSDFSLISIVYSSNLIANTTAQLLSEATYYWRVRAVDNASNIGEWSSAWKLVISTGAPSDLQILINAGANETNNESVYLVLYAVNATEVCFSNENGPWSAWENYAAIKVWTLETAPEGNKTNRTVHFKCRNKYNKESTPVNDSIVVNKKPPIVTITTPSQTININHITINWTCDEPIETLEYFEVCTISTEQLDGSENWVNVGKNYSYHFTSLEEGYHVIYARGKRTGADESGGSHSIYLLVDTLPPTSLRMTFQNVSTVDNIRYANASVIDITLYAEDNTSATKFVSGLYKIYLSNNNLNWLEYQSGTTALNWNLLWDVTDTDGMKTVYFKLTDQAGNWANISATIFLDRANPVNLNITMPNYYANSITISINLSADDPGYPVIGSGLWQMCFKEEGGNWSSWVNYSATYNYQLQSTADGFKTIYFKVKDKAGNENMTSRQIILDRTKPEFTIPTPSTLTEDSTYFNVTVTIVENNLGAIVPNLIYRIGDGIEITVQMELLSGKIFYLNITAIDLNASQGNYVYYKIQCTDLAGNINTSGERSEYVSPIPDIPELTTPGDYAIITTNTVTLNWTKNSTDPDWHFVEYRIVVEYYNVTMGNWICLVNQTTCDTYLVLSELKHNVTYYWNVSAINGSMGSPRSKTWQFTVKLPDLCIASDDISFYPADIVPVDTWVTITVTVHNIGEANATDVLVKFFKSGETIWSETIYSIPKGGTANVSASWYQEYPELFSIQVVVDHLNTVVEINEDNNRALHKLEFTFSPDVLPLNVTFSVANIGPEPKYLFVNDTITMTCNITNEGGEISKGIPFPAEFWLGRFENGTFHGTCIGNSAVEGVKNGEIKYHSIIWRAEVGDWTLMVFLNTTNISGIFEENMENNRLFRNFTISPRTAVTINSPVSMLTTDPSGTLSYTITITNIGNISDTYNLTVEGLPSDWNYSFIYNSNEIKTVTLEPSETIEVQLKVKSSDKPGTYSFNVTASSIKDPRVVKDTILTAQIKEPKEPFPWYLLIIAIIVIAVVLATALLAKKGVVAVKRAKPRKAEKGFNYLVKDTDTKRAYEIFSNFAKDISLLCLTSTMPRKILSLYPKLKDSQAYWLSDITTTEEKTIHPERLEFEITKTIIDFVKKTKGAVMIDGIEYIVQNNGLERTLEFLHSVKDIISTNHGTLVVPINPSVFKEEELGKIEKVFDRVI